MEQHSMLCIVYALWILCTVNGYKPDDGLKV